MKKRQGLTLIEVILSLAIIGIILVVTLNIFGMGIKNIASAGDRTDHVLDAQTVIDQIINPPKNLGKLDNYEVVVKDTTKIVKIDGNDASIDVPGQIIILKDLKNNIELITFIRQSKED